MRFWFWMGLLAALASCAAPEAQPKTDGSGSEASAAAQPSSASLARQLVGKRLCRYPSGPDDTGNFEIELAKGGSIDGQGDVSGAAGILQLQNGNWQIQETTLLVELLFKGKMAGKEQENLVKFQLSTQALLESQEECMAVHPGF